MGAYIERDDLIVAGVTLLMERTNIKKELALSSAKELASKIPTEPDWGRDGKDRVRADAEVGFLTDLLKPYLRPPSSDGKDEDISFADPPPNPVAQLDAILEQLRQQDAAARPATQILRPAAPSPSSTTFAKAAAPVLGPTGEPILPPALRSGYAMASLNAHATVSVAKAASAALAKPVAKTAAPRSLRIVRKGS